MLLARKEERGSGEKHGQRLRGGVVCTAAALWLREVVKEMSSEEVAE